MPIAYHRRQVCLLDGLRLRAIKVAIHTGFTQSVLVHQLCNPQTRRPLLAQHRHLGRREGMLTAKAHAGAFRMGDPL